MSNVEAPHRAKADQPAATPVAAADQPLYASRVKVYPKRVFGKVRSVKWAVLIACLALYYVLPWLRWDRGAGVPDQAVLVDIFNARIFFFWVEIWPQEIYFLTGALILGAFALFAGFTYLLAGWAREQVCTYMCPWPRFQAAMLDENSLVVTYRDWRGEPRGKLKEEGHGDCIDCFACVHVCPTGIDIRDGQQLECIGCGLCVDACDSVMAKLGKPKGLVAFETLKNLAASAAATAGLPPGPERQKAGMAARHMPRFVRPRTIVYAGAIAAVSLAMVGAFLLRSTLDVTVIRDRAPLFVRLSDGGIRNAFTVKIVNKTREAAPLALALDAPQGFRMTVQDAPLDAQGRPLLARRPDGIAQYRVFVTVAPDRRVPEETHVAFRLLDARDRVVASERSAFRGPGHDHHD